jgi:hypothetical protein
LNPLLLLPPCAALRTPDDPPDKTRPEIRGLTAFRCPTFPTKPSCLILCSHSSPAGGCGTRGAAVPPFTLRHLHHSGTAISRCRSGLSANRARPTSTKFTFAVTVISSAGYEHRLSNSSDLKLASSCVRLDTGVSLHHTPSTRINQHSRSEQSDDCNSSCHGPHNDRAL